MIAQKHTPGPWFWRDDVNTGEYDLSPGVLTTNLTDGTPWGDEIDRANARLIAAAPEMLEALYEAEEYFYNLADADHDETGFVPNKEMKLLTVVRAAIAKATGK